MTPVGLEGSLPRKHEGGWKMYLRFNMNMSLERCYFGIMGFFCGGNVCLEEFLFFLYLGCHLEKVLSWFWRV